MSNFKRIRQNRKLKRADAADKIGIHVSHLDMIESGKRNPSIETLLKMAQVYKCSIGDFFSEKTTRNV